MRYSNEPANRSSLFTLAALQIESLESRLLLSVQSTDGFRALHAAAIAGSPAIAPAAYVDVPFVGTLATFSSVPSPTAGNPLTDNPSVRIQWGDGTLPTIISASTILSAVGSGSTYQAAAPHVYTAARTFHATVYFFEGATLEAKASVKLSVVTASAGGVTLNTTLNPTTTNLFNGIVGTFSGFGTMLPADITGGITIDWGDGQTSPATVTSLPNDVYQISGSNYYSVPGVHPVQFSASFNPPSSELVAIESINSTIIVHRPNGSAAPPPVIGTSLLAPGIAGIVADESESMSQIVGSFTGVPYEQPAVSQYKATVKFSGMPIQSITDVSFDDAGSLSFTAVVPTFQNPGRYSAIVRLYRDEQPIGLQVLAIPVTLNSTTSRFGSDSPLGGMGVTLSAIAGTAFAKPLGTFTTDSVGTLTAPQVVTIDWGDGNTSAGTFTQTTGGGEVSPGAYSTVFAVTGIHTYATAGRYRIRVLSDTNGDPLGLAIDDTAIVKRA